MKVNEAKKNDITPMGEGIKVLKEKKPSRETFVCGACGQLWHMRTNKNCPKYGEDPEAQLESTDIEKSGKFTFVDPSIQSQQIAPSRRSISKSSTKIAAVDSSTKIPLELDSLVANSGLEHIQTKRIVELSNFEKHMKQETMYSTEGLVKWQGKEDRKWWEEQKKQRNEVRLREDRARRQPKDEIRMLNEQERLDELKRYEEDIKRERDDEEQLKAKKKKPDLPYECLDDLRSKRYDKRTLESDRSGKRRSAELGKFGADILLPTKLRRGGGGEVVLANILEGILDVLVKDRHDLSYLFQKPVSTKEAPDYLGIIERPMDLSRIRESVRNMEYKSREDFRHDIWQITFNAHKYNSGRNPGIPPLADRLLEYSDYLLNENDDNLTAAEAGIENRDF